MNGYRATIERGGDRRQAAWDGLRRLSRKSPVVTIPNGLPRDAPLRTSIPYAGLNRKATCVCVCTSIILRSARRPEQSPIYYREFGLFSTQLNYKQCPVGPPGGEGEKG